MSTLTQFRGEKSRLLKQAIEQLSAVKKTIQQLEALERTNSGANVNELFDFLFTLQCLESQADDLLDSNVKQY